MKTGFSFRKQVSFEKETMVVENLKRLVKKTMITKISEKFLK
jgi:hypothetical protein